MRSLLVFMLALGLSTATPAPAQSTMQLLQLVQALQIGDFGPISEQLYNANTVYVVRVTELAGVRLQGDRLTRVLETRVRHLRSLRAMVRNSREAMRSLERHGERLDNVIFATATNDGTATLYVDNR